MPEVEIKMQTVLLAVILSVVIIGGVVGVSAITPPNAQEKIVQHVTNDNAVRALQVFDISQVEKGSQITSVNAVFTLSSNIGDDCVLILNEDRLNKNEISDPFVCSLNNTIPLKTIGLHALQSKLNSENFNIEIKSTNGIIQIPSSVITLDISYLTPTYFAHIENGIVVNVIVSDQNFVDTLQGEWVEGKTGVGYSYDGVLFIPPQPYPSWILDGDKWIAPSPKPLGYFEWNESVTAWVEYTPVNWGG